MIEQLIAHLLGDYVFQSSEMATRKTKDTIFALFHATLYLIPFLFLTESWKALLLIWGSHVIIDRFRLARFVIYWKNIYLDRDFYPLTETGNPPTMNPGLALAILIVVDNTIHLCINAFAIGYWS